MRIKYNDGSMEDVPLEQAAKLIFTSQRYGGNMPFEIMVNEDMTEGEWKQELQQLQYYVDDLRTRHRWAGYMNL